MKRNLQKLKFLSFGLVIGLAGKVNGQCTVPGSVTATPSVICSGATTSLNAISIGSSINWYTVATSGVPTGTSASGADFSISPVNTTTYYAEAFVAAAGSGTNTYNYTGSSQSITIPTGVTQITITAYGAQGGSNPLGVVGGLGGMATGILTVTPGDVLNIYVGGTNGYNGGGAASNPSCITCGAGNGGGASDVRLNGITLADRKIVAGGGGGAAGNRVNGLGRGAGGGGGAGYYGGGGGAAWPSTSTVLPFGGDQISGGAGGTSAYATAAPGNNGTAGSLGFGGNGGMELVSNQGGSGAGAVGAVGGGTVGSNGTYSGNFTGQSGAGGSSYIAALISGSTTSGVQTGDGQIIINGLIPVGGCTSASRTAVTVTVLPIPTITVNSGTICVGQSFTMVPSGASTYTIEGGNAVVSPTISSTYTVIGTSSAGCNSQSAATSSVTVNAGPIPTVTAVSSTSILCVGQTASLTASGATTYTWNTTSNNTVIAISPTVTTTYTVTGEANSCTNTFTISQTVSACTGIDNKVTSSIGVLVYPNPNSGLFSIELNNGSIKNIEVMDVTGRIVLAKTTSNDKIDFNINTLSNGIYYVKIQSNNSVEIVKVVKQ
ncbi:MAG: T9SS type A sorting domain-containing protein [Bacteroidota bacterium]|nr:T9SS type A sorting domain-containing protein [Bacteroidota bacterium]